MATNEEKHPQTKTGTPEHPRPKAEDDSHVTPSTMPRFPSNNVCLKLSV